MNSVTCRELEETEKIANCKLYKKSNIIECVECQKDHFLELNGSCTLRTLYEIENCIQYNTTKNECLKCAENFNINTANTVCYSPLDNCTTDNGND